MEFKKCVRCGSFFVTEGNICQTCIPKDRLDIIKFQDYIDANIDNISPDNIAINTGISVRNVNRFLNGFNNQNVNL